MPEIQGMKKLLSETAKKRFCKFNQYGTSQYGFSELGDEDIYLTLDGQEPILLSGIYRTCRIAGETKHYLDPYYIVKNPRSDPQQAQRQKYADGVLSWQNLTQEQKAVYNKKAIGKHMSGYNLFLKEYLLSS